MRSALVFHDAARIGALDQTGSLGAGDRPLGPGEPSPERARPVRHRLPSPSTASTARPRSMSTMHRWLVQSVRVRAISPGCDLGRSEPRNPRRGDGRDHHRRRVQRGDVGPIRSSRGPIVHGHQRQDDHRGRTLRLRNRRRHGHDRHRSISGEGSKCTDESRLDVREWARIVGRKRQRHRRVERQSTNRCVLAREQTASGSSRLPVGGQRCLPCGCRRCVQPRPLGRYPRRRPPRPSLHDLLRARRRSAVDRAERDLHEDVAHDVDEAVSRCPWP